MPAGKLRAALSSLCIISALGYASVSKAQSMPPVKISGSLTENSQACTDSILVEGGSTVTITGKVMTGESVKWSLYAAPGNNPNDFSTRFFVTQPPVPSVGPQTSPPSGSMVRAPVFDPTNDPYTFVEACINNISADTIQYKLVLSVP